MSQIEVVFSEVAPADAARLATDLAETINASSPGSEAEVVGGDKDKMDFGAIVGIVFGAAATGTLAKGIADWIRRQGDPALTLKTKKGEVVVKGGLDLAIKREIILKALDEGAL